MNYISAVYGVVVVIILIDWFARGRRSYRGQDVRHEEIDAAIGM
jgi:choline transport protein